MPPPVAASQPAVSTRWEDEDKPEEAPESWEEEGPQTQYKQPSKKAAKKALGKAKDAQTSAEPSTTPQDARTQQVKQQHMVERADFEHTQDMFSGISEVVDIANPKDEKDFEALALAVATKLQSHS